jgi:hypothetical protein
MVFRWIANPKTVLGRVTLEALAAAGLLVFLPLSGPAVADEEKSTAADDDDEHEGANPCRQTSRLVRQSCQHGARSDYWLTLANCENLSLGADRKACQQQARKDLKEAQGLCKEQFAARQEICEVLGGQAYDPLINPADFVPRIDNPFFPLTPGTTFIYEGRTADGVEHNEVVVSRKTKEILGVTCIEIRDTVAVNGEVVEDTLDWFAQDKWGNVWYFGENSKELEGGEIVSLEGSWEAGVDGAKPGIIMEARPRVGDLYRQEFFLGEAEDVAEVVSLKESVTVPWGSFPRCLATKDFSALEPEVFEHKFYAKGVGFVLSINLESGDRLELVQIQRE